MTTRTTSAKLKRRRKLSKRTERRSQLPRRPASFRAASPRRPRIRHHLCMKLHFEADLPFHKDAIDAVVDLFAGDDAADGGGVFTAPPPPRACSGMRRCCPGRRRSCGVQTPADP